LSPTAKAGTTPAAELNVAVVTYAEATGTWSFPRDFRDTDMPGWAMAEFIVGEATLGWQPSEIIELLRDLHDRATGSAACGHA
jgi:hypothetical protein